MLGVILVGLVSGVMTACCSDVVYAFGLWPMVIGLGCHLGRLLLQLLKSANFSCLFLSDVVNVLMVIQGNSTCHHAL